MLIKGMSSPESEVDFEEIVAVAELVVEAYKGFVKRWKGLGKYKRPTRCDKCQHLKHRIGALLLPLHERQRWVCAIKEHSEYCRERFGRDIGELYYKQV